jgi:hypothetical protein
MLTAPPRRQLVYGRGRLSASAESCANSIYTDWSRSVFYHAALQRPAEDIDAFLRNACDDEAVRREVKSLLTQAANPRSLLRQPALAAIAMGSETGAESLVGASVAQCKFTAALPSERRC